MHSTHPLLRILFVAIAAIVMLGIFGLSVWRGSIAFGFSLKTKTILLLSLGLIGITMSAFLLSSLPWRFTDIIGIILIWGIYTIWVLTPLLIVRDIVSFWYKIPPIAMIIGSIIRIGIGMYYGAVTKVTQLNISSPSLTQNHKIVFISDLHVEAVHHRGYIQSIVNKIQELQPDFVLLGGDLLNTAKADYISAFEPFNQLKMPVYATLGNHDNMGDTKAVPGIFETTKIIPLRNQSVSISGIQIVGIDDKSYRDGKKLTDVLDESQIATGAQFTLLVSHQPQKLSKLEGYPINLELAGHTHNGQFVPLKRLIGAFNDYAYGRYDEAGKTAFVSQGIGAWGGRIRIGTQSELVLITLKKAQ